jgi:hypothetical protein
MCLSQVGQCELAGENVFEYTLGVAAKAVVL